MHYGCKGDKHDFALPSETGMWITTQCQCGRASFDAKRVDSRTVDFVNPFLDGEPIPLKIAPA